MKRKEEKKARYLYVMFNGLFITAWNLIDQLFDQLLLSYGRGGFTSLTWGVQDYR